jgi:hypothetical protein
MNSITDWLRSPAPKLEKNDRSRMHSLVAAARANRQDEAADFLAGGHVFVVQHDWAAAFANASDYEGGHFNLPYPTSTFEFRISGRTVVAITVQEHVEHLPELVRLFVSYEDGWIGVPDFEEEGSSVTRLVVAEIKAICVALDAGVAIHKVVAPREKVNLRRAQAGKVPFFSYRVVSLKVRSQSERDGAAGGRAKRRLHFRRGHWRQLGNGTKKTWVRWTLVGDPSLGFIDKHYRL